MASKGPRKTFIEGVLRGVHRVITYKYSSMALAMEAQRYVVRKARLVATWEVVYTKVYNDDLEKNKTKYEEGESPRWPAPSTLNSAGVFREAGQAMFDSLNRSVSQPSRNMTKDKTLSNSDLLVFTTTREFEDFTKKAKTAAIKALSKGIETQGKKAIRFYSDILADPENEGMSKKQAMGQAEDMLFRPYVHREHLGATVTGSGVLSAELQALDVMFEGLGSDILAKAEKSKEVADFFGPVIGTFEVFPTKANQVKIRTIKNPSSAFKGLVERRYGAWSWNPPGDRKEDFRNKRSLFERLVSEALDEWLDKASPKVLEELMSIKHIESVVANTTANICVAPIKSTMEKNIDLSMQLEPIVGLSGGKAILTFSPDKRIPPDIPLQGEKEITVAQKRKIKKTRTVSAIRLQETIRKYLAEAIRANMGAGGPPRPAGPLVYRTGRFAKTVTVTQVRINPSTQQPSVQVNYMRYPYAVFEGQQGREPSKLIHTSIRDIIKRTYPSILNNAKNRDIITRRGHSINYVHKKDWPMDRRNI